MKSRVIRVPGPVVSATQVSPAWAIAWPMDTRVAIALIDVYLLIPGCIGVSEIC
jgi:hypothetical protein